MLVDFVLKNNTNQAYADFLDCLRTANLSLFTVIKNSEFHPAECVQDEDCQETLVLGNFPKLPPYHIERTSKVSP